jgi:hypothetical protein
MNKRVQRSLLSELRLHPELEKLGSRIERCCVDLKIPFNQLCPLRHRVISITPDNVVIGNLPAYRKAIARGVSVLWNNSLWRRRWRGCRRTKWSGTGTDQKKRASFDHEDGATWAIQARDPGRLRTPDALAR